MILDFDFGFLEEGVRLVDVHLDRLDQEARGSIDPDAFGVFDRIEYVTGLGFVLCQQYFAAHARTCDVTKADALKVGPLHRTGVPMAAVMNDAANYWKHSSEWGNGDKDHRARATREGLQRLGVDLDQSYVLANVLFTLLSPFPPRFGRLLPFVEGWRDSIGAADVT